MKKSKELDSQMKSGNFQENSYKQDPQQFEYGEYYDSGKIASDLKMAETFNQQRNDFEQNMQFQEREYPEEYMVSVNQDDKGESQVNQEEFDYNEAEG